VARLLALCFLAVQIFSAHGQDPGPEELVRKMTAEVLDAVRSDKELAAGDRQKALRLAEEKVLPHIDFEEATRLALGRSWNQASAEQKRQLVEEFRRMLVRTYANAISSYQGQTMKVLPVRMKPDDTEATVRNQYIRSGAKPVQVDYTMRKTDGGWKIYDIIVEGVSLVITYRSEFDAVVKQEGIDGLIKRIMAKNAPNKVG
jgi:phospholipid transport system substrate-binding protein